MTIELCTLWRVTIFLKILSLTLMACNLHYDNILLTYISVMWHARITTGNIMTLYIYLTWISVMWHVRVELFRKRSPLMRAWVQLLLRVSHATLESSCRMTGAVTTEMEQSAPPYPVLQSQMPETNTRNGNQYKASGQLKQYRVSVEDFL